MLFHQTALFDTKERNNMTVKELIEELSKFPQDRRVVVWNETLDNNHWRIDISEDEINNADVVLYPNNKT